jgi:ectoine hydroxylase-related dioxygenase (phytanoyl-CoA dioxygenase family)
MLKLISSSDSWHLFKDDPVRPHLSALFRTAPGREAFVLEDDLTGKPRAVICVAYTNQVPQDERELDYFSQAAHQEDEQGSIAVFYTVWSYDRGAGREIVFAAQDHTQARGCSRWVTLSPLTEMAERFHIKNGAVLHSRHSTCQNFEY